MKKPLIFCCAVIILILFACLPISSPDRDMVSISFINGILSIRYASDDSNNNALQPFDLELKNLNTQNYVLWLDGTHHDTSMWKIVVLDAGHGGSDSGTCSGELLEKDICLDVVLRLRTILEDAGVQVYLIREDDRYIDHRERILIANEIGATLFLSVHCDWFKDSSLSGTTTLYYPSRALTAGKLTELDYARIIQNELAEALETKDRGIIDRTDLAVLKNAKMPSVLVELGFLSNETDLMLLSREAFRQKTAEALSIGILKALACID